MGQIEAPRPASNRTAVKAPVADHTGNTREKLVVCMTSGGAVSN